MEWHLVILMAFFMMNSDMHRRVIEDRFDLEKKVTFRSKGFRW